VNLGYLISALIFFVHSFWTSLDRKKLFVFCLFHLAKSLSDSFHLSCGTVFDPVSIILMFHMSKQFQTGVHLLQISSILSACWYFSPRKRGSMFFRRWFVCLCVCMSVTTMTKKIVDGFVPNFMGRFLGGKGRPSSCFVTIGRGMWK